MGGFWYDPYVFLHLNTADIWREKGGISHVLTEGVIKSP